MVSFVGLVVLMSLQFSFKKRNMERKQEVKLLVREKEDSG